MSAESNDQALFRDYLLGRLSGAAREEFEQRLLTADQVLEQLEAAEDDLVDEYVAGDLTADDKNMFEKYFLNSPERRQKQRFALAFKKYAELHRVPTVQPDQKTAASKPGWWQFLTASPLRAVAVAAVVILAALGVWRVFIYKSDLDQGLIALNKAYQQQRPLEARISQLDYAPFANTRGGAPDRVDLRQRDRAERYLQDAVRDHPGAGSYDALGRFYLAGKDFDKSITQFNEALKIDPNNAQVYADLGAAFFEKGKTSGLTSSSTSLEDLARGLENLNKALSINSGLLDALFNRALALQEQRLWAQAESAWNDYLKHDANSRWADEARRKLAEVQRHEQGEVRSKAELINSFKDAFNRHDDATAWKLVSESYTSAGNVIANDLLNSYLSPAPDQRPRREENLHAFSYLAQLELERAGDSYHADVAHYYLSVPPERQEGLAKIQAQMDQAFADIVSAKSNEAINLYQTCKQDFARLGDDSETIFTNYRLGHSYVVQANLDKSREIFSQLLGECDKHHYRWLAGQTLINLAHISVAQNRYSDAIEFSKRGVALFQTAGYIDGLMGTLRQLADEYQTVNKTSESLSCLQQSLLVAGNHFIDPVTRWGLYMTVAFNLDSLGLLTATAAYQTEALNVALQVQRPLVTSRSYAYLGATYGKLKNFPEAIKNLTLAYETGASLAGDPNGMDMMANSSLQLGDLYRATNQPAKALESYDLCLQVYQSLRMPYFDYSAHRGKLLTYVAMQDNAATERELSTILSSLEQYRSGINEESQRNSFFETQQEIYDAGINFAAERKHDPQAAFEYSEMSRARTLLDALKQSGRISDESVPELKFSSVSAPLSLRQVQAELPADVQLVQFAVLNDKVVVWLITREAFQSRTTAIGKDELDRKIRNYLNLLTAPGGAPNSTESAELYNLLIAPVQSLLDKNRLVVIVPDKSLNYLPFAALQTPQSNRYLIEDYQIELAPSSSVFINSTQTAAAKNQNGPETLLSVGNPSFDRAIFSNLQDLPAAATEAESITVDYKSPLVLTGDNAREQQITAQMKNADVVHLALHYLMNPDSEMLSELVLAKEPHASGAIEGQLHAAEIYKMKLPRTRLAVLSACQTGIDRSIAGEGAVSIARPFLAAGVPLVVASLWPVESDSTTELMINFHKQRKLAHQSTVAALRQAQLEMLSHSNSEYRRPYYWAPFVVIGGYAKF